jgi:hypothetical protein
MKSHYYPLPTTSAQPKLSFTTPTRQSPFFPTSEHNVIRATYERPSTSALSSHRVPLNVQPTVQRYRSPSQVNSIGTARESYANTSPVVFDNVKQGFAVNRTMMESGYVRRPGGSLTRVVRHPDVVEMTETRYNFVIPKSNEAGIRSHGPMGDEIRASRPSITISRPQFDSSRVLGNSLNHQMSKNYSESRIMDPLNRIQRVTVNDIAPKPVSTQNKVQQNIVPVQETNRSESTIRVMRVIPGSSTGLNEETNRSRNTSIIKDGQVDRTRTFTRFDLKTSIMNTNRLASTMIEDSKSTNKVIEQETTQEKRQLDSFKPKPIIQTTEPIEQMQTMKQQIEVSPRDASTMDESKDQKSQAQYRPFSFGEIQKDDAIVSPVQDKTPKDSITVQDPKTLNSELRESIILNLEDKTQVNDRTRTATETEQPRKRASSANVQCRSNACSIDLGKNIKDSKFMSSSMINLEQSMKKSILKKKGSINDFKKKKVLINENDNTNHLVDKYLDKAVPEEPEQSVPTTFRQVIRISHPNHNHTPSNSIGSVGLPVPNLSNISYMHPIKLPARGQVSQQPRVVYSVLRDSTNLSEYPYSYRR